MTRSPTTTNTKRTVRYSKVKIPAVGLEIDENYTYRKAAHRLPLSRLHSYYGLSRLERDELLSNAKRRKPIVEKFRRRHRQDDALRRSPNEEKCLNGSSIGA